MNQMTSEKLQFFTPNIIIPTLPLLDDMVEKIKKDSLLPSLDNTMIIGVQHILDTTGSLFKALISLGIKPENMYFSGKIYSTSPEVAKEIKKIGIKLFEFKKLQIAGEYEDYVRKNITEMWKIFVKEITGRVIDRIIILDEGARCLETMPDFITMNYAVAAIEQTQGGLYSNAVDHLFFPLIEVASSAVKNTLEPPLIAQTIVKKLDYLFQEVEYSHQTNFGVVGNGAIGNAIAKFLLNKEYSVIVYDENPYAFQKILNKKLCRAKNILDVINNSGIIFGCTGKDITKDLDLLNIIKKDRILVSCTSEDKEFKSLLQSVVKNNCADIDPLQDIICKTYSGNKIKILRGGFPFNFDRKRQSVPAHQIEIIRAALLGACIEAIMNATKPITDGVNFHGGRRQKLSATIQKFIALHWLPRQNHLDENTKLQLIEIFNDEKWINNNSGGELYENLKINQSFSFDNNASIKNYNVAKL